MESNSLGGDNTGHFVSITSLLWIFMSAVKSCFALVSKRFVPEGSLRSVLVFVVVGDELKCLRLLPSHYDAFVLCLPLFNSAIPANYQTYERCVILIPLEDLLTQVGEPKEGKLGGVT
jgi:hypothetical protein